MTRVNSRSLSAYRVAVVALLASVSPLPGFCHNPPIVSGPPGLADTARAATSRTSSIDDATRRAADSIAVAAADTSTVAATAAAIDSGSGFRRFVRDVCGDYEGFYSKGVALRLGIGGAAAGVVHIWDSDVATEAAEPLPETTEFLNAGDYYGGPSGQWPLAIGWWAISHFAHSAKDADAGRDLVRAQVSAASWTYLIKFATQRTRPNGDPRAFPSGHTSATFATATVLQRHYGWKLGVPFYALGVFAGMSRITAEKHWASDVVFGAAVGIASGYTVTRRVHTHPVTLGPAIYPGGVGVSLTLGP